MGSKPGRQSTVRARELGVELRRCRKAAELTETVLARRVGWSPTKVSRMETGARGVRDIDVAIYLSKCEVKEPELERLLELARGNDQRYWLSKKLQSLIIQENFATRIVSFEPMVVPGLLQTEEYARAVFRWGKQVLPERIETLVSARMARQEVLTKYSPPNCLSYVHENALRLSAGGAAVMQEQMLRLLFADSRPQSQVRVIPAAAGPGALGDSFVLLGFAECSSVGFVSLQTTNLFIEEPSDIERYRKVLARLEEVALDRDHSREFLANLASEYDRAASRECFRSS
jgi:transcriptional regulator with XRE-family HTH domain